MGGVPADIPRRGDLDQMAGRLGLLASGRRLGISDALAGGAGLAGAGGQRRIRAARLEDLELQFRSSQATGWLIDDTGGPALTEAPEAQSFARVECVFVERPIRPPLRAGPAPAASASRPTGNFPA